MKTERKGPGVGPGASQTGPHDTLNVFLKTCNNDPLPAPSFRACLCCGQCFHLLGAVFILLSLGTKFCSPGWLAAALRPLHLLLTSNPSSFSDFVKQNGAKTQYQKNKKQIGRGCSEAGVLMLRKDVRGHCLSLR